MSDKPQQRCLHCEISELITARAKAGDPVGEKTIGKLVEVIADVVNSAPTDKKLDLVIFAIGVLGKLTGGEVSFEDAHVRMH